MLDVKFSPKELAILELLASGFTNEEISEKLSLSKRTVEGIRANMIIKTKSRNTAGLVAYGFRSGLLV
ncbi:MAG: LuxR family transcriptional regulator [Pedobacter sp.]|nr:MAG: LuxR family transcriptional regulator [Pedobacter sp.]